MRLIDLCKLSSGRHFRSQPDGTVYYLKATDFDQDFQLKEDLEPSVLEDKHYSKLLLEDGDVMVVLKGPRFFAATYREELVPAMASSAFATLKRINQKKVLPEYVAWFINHPRTQTWLSGKAMGTSMPSLSLKTLGELQIQLPPLEIQQSIVNIDRLRRRERQITSELSHLKDILLNEQLFHSLPA